MIKYKVIRTETYSVIVEAKNEDEAKNAHVKNNDWIYDADKTEIYVEKSR